LGSWTRTKVLCLLEKSVGQAFWPEDEILEEYLASRNSHAPSQETNKMRRDTLVT
jgi:hypothetical protein